MSEKQPTFELIKSLTKAEKRMVKLHAGKTVGGKESIYIELFNILDKQKKYSSEEIISSPLNIKKSRLSNLLSYVNNLILRSLRINYDDKNVISELQYLLSNIQIYQSKGLAASCKKAIKKLKKLAYKYEKYNYVLEVLRWERRLLKYSNDVNEYRIVVASTLEEEKKLIGILQEQVSLNELFFQIYSIYLEQGPIRQEAYKKKLDNLIKSPLLAKNTKYHSFLSALLFHNCYTIYYEALNDDLNAMEHRRNLIQVFDDHPHFIEEDAENYISVLNNLLIGLKNMEYHDEFFKYLSILKKLPSMVMDQSIRKSLDEQVFPRAAVLELDYYIMQKQYEKGILIAEDITHGIDTHGQSMTRMRYNSICLEMAFCYFMEKMYRKSFKWINRFIQEKGVKMRDDIYYSGRILNILLHFESENYSYLEYDIHSTQNVMQKNEKLYGYEEIILSSINDFILKGEMNKKQFYIKLKDLLEEYAKSNKIDTNALYGLDIMEWLSRNINA